jgi:hypothetical protein
MQTNLISIVDMAPIFPRAPILEMEERLLAQVGSLDDESAQCLVAAIFNVNKLEELVDSEGLIEEYELEPAINKDELELLAYRLIKALPDSCAVNLAHAKTIVRNTINCVPRSLEDLVDYVEPEVLSFINAALLTDSRGPAPAELLDAEAAKLTPGRLEIVLGMAHESLASQPMENHLGLTSRQRLLERAGIYYTLHRYGHPIASLWLSKCLNPLNYCTCPNFDCEARNFGFTDAQGSALLALDNLPYIQDMFERESEFAPMRNKMTTPDICANHLVELLFGAEALMLVDQGRLESSNIEKMLDFIGDRRNYLPELYQIRLGKVVVAFNELYEDGTNSDPGLEDAIEGFFFDSVRRFSEYSASNTRRPPMEMLPLWDAHNFLAVGTNLNDMNIGTRLSLLFWQSMYDPAAYEAMSDLIMDLLIAHQDDLSDSSFAVLEGYLVNFSYVLARRSVSTTAHCESIFEISNEPDVVNYLAEFGHRPAMELRMKEATNPREVDYWALRLTAS